MTGGSLESILKSTHEIWDTHGIRGGMGEERVQKAFSPLLDLWKILAVSIRCWGLACVSYTLSIAFMAGNALLILISCVQSLFH